MAWPAWPRNRIQNQLKSRDLRNSSGTVSCVEGTCEVFGDALPAFVGVKLSAMMK